MNNPDRIIEALLKRWSAIINLVGFISILLLGIYILCRIPFYHRLLRQAASERERDYSTAKLIACYLAAYAFNVLCLTVLSVDGFGRYWPAFSAKFIDGSGIGLGNHVVALCSDAILCCLCSGACYWIATTMGSTATTWDGRTMFIDPPWVVLRERCAPLLAELGQLDASNPENKGRIMEITKLIALHKSIWR